MFILLQIQEFLNAHFVRLGFIIIVFIYLFSLVPQCSGRMALQMMRYFLLTNVMLIWVITLVQFLKVNELLYFERATGLYAAMYIVVLFCSMVLPLVLFHPKLGNKAWVLFLVSLLSCSGFWMEQFTLMMTSLHRDYLPATYTSGISFIPSFYLLTIAQCLLLAVIFVLTGTWIKWYKDKKIIKNHIIKQQ
jgi:Ni/Fe-hydrogenase subunit HybB-like protein